MAEMKFFLLSALVIFATFMGFHAPLFYVVFMFILYPVYISIRTESLRKSGKLLIESKKNQWIFYMQGIPVKEAINSLHNIHAPSENELGSIFNRMLNAKLLVLFTLLAITCHNFYTYFILGQIPVFFNNIWLIIATLLIGLLFTVFIVQKIRNCIKIKQLINKKTWIISCHENHGIDYYSAYHIITEKNEVSYSPFLSTILK
ncbi:hypothetical protein [Pragia fontium]|uniref:hypothetical protein n=1 Tax=Pragia fontium TaxID=82985 RepID=UPI000F6D33E2|nr:hypothetical protein [Pragia fontium]VEJ56877.1 Uncharacterised protein [Pragia fontium]